MSVHLWGMVTTACDGKMETANGKMGVVGWTWHEMYCRILQGESVSEDEAAWILHFPHNGRESMTNITDRGYNGDRTYKRDQEYRNKSK